MHVSITYIMITNLFSIVILSFTSRKNEISRSVVVDTGDICVFQNLRSTKHDIHQYCSRYHNFLVDLQQSFWKVSLELSALRGEMNTLRKANQKLTNEVRSYNHSLEVLEKQTKYLTVSLLEVWRTTELLNTSLSRQLQDRVGR